MTPENEHRPVDAELPAGKMVVLCVDSEPSLLPLFLGAIFAALVIVIFRLGAMLKTP